MSPIIKPPIISIQKCFLRLTLDNITTGITNKKSILSGLPKLKGGVKFIHHRPIDGRPKVVTISRKAQ